MQTKTPEQMTDKEIRDEIKTLENHMEVATYGSQEIAELYALKSELQRREELF